MAHVNVSDHGDLSGLSDDDHTQYLLADGSRTGAASSRQVLTSGITTGSIRPISDSTSALNFQNASGSNIVLLDTVNQTLYMGDAPSGETPSYYVGKTFSITSGQAQGYGSFLQLSPSASSSALVFGNKFRVRVPTGNASQITGTLYGSFGNIEHAGSGTLSNAYAYAGDIRMQSTGNITNAYTFFASSPSFSGSGTVTRSAGLYVQNYGNAKTTNSYGIYVDVQLGSNSGTYAIYTRGGDIVFNELGYASDVRMEGDTDTHLFFVDGSADKIGISENAPTALLDLGASTTDRSSIRIRDGTAPTSPNNGDIWQDGADLLVRIGGTTYTLDKTAV